MDRYISITAHDHMDKMDRYISITMHNHKTVPMFLGQNNIMSSPLDTADRALANSQLSNVRKEHAWNGTSSEILLGCRSRRMVVTCKQTDKKSLLLPHTARLEGHTTDEQCSFNTVTNEGRTRSVLYNYYN